MRTRLLLPLAFCLLLSSGRCPAQGDDPLSLTLPNGRVLHFETPEQKEKFESARAARLSAATPAPTLKTADHPAVASLTSPAPAPAAAFPAATPLPGTPMVNTSAPAFTGDYYGLPKSGAWVGRKVTLAVAYVRQRSADGEVPVRFSAYTWNGRPGAASEHMEGGWVTLVATESAARKLVVQAGTQFRYTVSGMTITMLHGVVQPLTGQDKGFGVYIDY